MTQNSSNTDPVTESAPRMQSSGQQLIDALPFIVVAEKGGSASTLPMADTIGKDTGHSLGQAPSVDHQFAEHDREYDTEPCKESATALQWFGMHKRRTANTNHLLSLRTEGPTGAPIRAN